MANYFNFGILGKFLPLDMFNFVCMYEGEDEGGSGDKDNAEELARLQDEITKLKSENDDLRLEVFSDDYTNFLSSKKDDNKDIKGDKDKKDLDLKRLKPEEIYAKVVADAEAKMEAKLKEVRDGVSASENERMKREVNAFKSTHPDFDIVRPYMYGLTLDPNNKNLGLADLYNKAKEKMSTAFKKEDPKPRKSFYPDVSGGDEQYEKNKKLSSAEAATSALEEVKAQLGDIPSA